MPLLPYPMLAPFLRQQWGVAPPGEVPFPEEPPPPQFTPVPFVDQPDPTIVQRIALALQQQEYGPISRDPKNAAMQQFLRGIAGGFSTGTLTQADVAEKNRQALNQRLAQRQAFANQQNIAESQLNRWERLARTKGEVATQGKMATGAATDVFRKVDLPPDMAEVLGLPASVDPEVLRSKTALETSKNRAVNAPGGMMYARNLENSKDIAEAVMAGAQPPTFVGMARGNMVGEIRAYMARAKQWGPNGFDLNKASLNYLGIQQWIKTVNGRQQVQIRQSAQTVLETMDKVKELNAQLSNLIPRSQATALNRLSAGAARDWGVFGKEAQDVASQLKTIVADVVPELSNVYQAGGVPTEEAMKLAERNLNENWSPNRINAAVDIIQQTLGYRLISIKSTAAIGVDGLPVVRANEKASDIPLAGTKMRILRALRAGNKDEADRLLDSNRVFNDDPQVNAEAAMLMRRLGGR